MLARHQIHQRRSPPRSPPSLPLPPIGTCLPPLIFSGFLKVICSSPCVIITGLLCLALGRQLLELVAILSHAFLIRSEQQVRHMCAAPEGFFLSFFFVLCLLFVVFSMLLSCRTPDHEVHTAGQQTLLCNHRWQRLYLLVPLSLRGTMRWNPRLLVAAKYERGEWKIKQSEIVRDKFSIFFGVTDLWKRQD